MNLGLICYFVENIIKKINNIKADGSKIIVISAEVFLEITVLKHLNIEVSDV